MWVLVLWLHHARTDVTPLSHRQVSIITGFPCMLNYTPPTETDGPPGALAIARACVALGKAVYILTDQANEQVLVAACANTGLPGQQLRLESFPPKAEWGPREEARLKEVRRDMG
jgi:hypothetical protein